MNKQIILLIFLSIILESCRSDSQKKITRGDIIKIDISKDYPKSVKRAQDVIADTEWVPLETNKDILIGDKRFLHYVSEKYIIVITYGSRWEIFIFDRSGKSVSHISRKGKGPEEYSSIRDVVFDEKDKEIFVFDNVGTCRVVVYSLTGQYKRTLKYSTDLELLRAYNFDDETMLVYDTKGMYDGAYNKKPYMLMSKKDGSISSILNINLPVRYNNKVIKSFTTPSGQEYSYSSGVSVPNRRNYGEDFVISDVSSDTIYLLKKNKDLIPLIVHTPSVHSTDPHLVCTTPFITDKFIVLFTTTFDYALMQKEEAPPANLLEYEFETGEITNVESNYYSDLKIMQKNIDARLYDVITLKDFYKQNKLSEKVKQLVSTLDEEDNPVVKITKFK